MATSKINDMDQQTSRHDVKKLIDERDERERRLILIGKTGHGKSSTGNSICGYKQFPTSSSSSSYTKKCSHARRTFNDIELIVYDTPGLFDTENDLNILKAQYCDVVKKASPGVHAFLIHFKIGNRFTDEEKRTIEFIKDIFGENATKYCVLIFTGEDNLLFNEETIEGYLKNADINLKQLLIQCENRYILFNNRAKPEEINCKIQQLLNIVDKMLLENNNRYYTNKDFVEAEQNFQEREKKQIEVELRKKEEAKQDLAKEISQSFEIREKRLEEENKELQKMVRKLRDNIRNESDQQGNTLLNTFLQTASVVGKAVAQSWIDSRDQNTNLNNRQQGQTVPDINAHQELLTNENPLGRVQSAISNPISSNNFSVNNPQNDFMRVQHERLDELDYYMKMMSPTEWSQSKK